MNLDYALQGNAAKLEAARAVVRAYDEAKLRAEVDASDANLEARFQAERGVIRMVSHFAGKTPAVGKMFGLAITEKDYRRFDVIPGGTVDDSMLVERLLNAPGGEKVVHIGEGRRPAPASRPR